jgi:hypothetical protein
MGFSVLGIFSLLTVPAVLVFWPFLEVSLARYIIDAIFAASVLYAPLMPIIWLLSGYDALTVSMNDIKKESVVDRILLAIARVRVNGWMRSLFPRVRLIVLMGLLLSLLLVLVHRHVSIDYWASLSGAQAWLHQLGMTLLPDIIKEILAGSAG